MIGIFLILISGYIVLAFDLPSPNVVKLTSIQIVFEIMEEEETIYISHQILARLKVME